MCTFTRNGHVSEAALGLYVLEDLPRSRRAPVEEHVLRCRRCHGEFRAVREFVSLLRLMAAGANPSHRLRAVN
jgi:anti-sigma factor RsiW